jgi:hypothetical protein
MRPGHEEQDTHVSQRREMHPGHEQHDTRVAHRRKINQEYNVKPTDNASYTVVQTQIPNRIFSNLYNENWKTNERSSQPTRTQIPTRILS